MSYEESLTYALISLLAAIIYLGGLLMFIGGVYGLKDFFIVGTILLIMGLVICILFISLIKIKVPRRIKENQDSAEKLYQKGLSYLQQEDLSIGEC